MKKTLVGAVAGVVGVLMLVAAPLASAHDRVGVSLNIGVPGVGYPAYPAYPAYPTYQTGPVVYAQPQPVYVAPAPVYYAEPRVYVRPAPVYYPGYVPVRYWEHGRYVYRYGHEGRHWR